MAKVTKICRVCGKEYEACQTPNLSNTFRWQDVSCSPECGAKYLHAVRVARGEVIEGSKSESEEVKAESEVTAYDEDYLGFDDEDDEDEDYESQFGSDDLDTVE